MPFRQLRGRDDDEGGRGKWLSDIYIYYIYVGVCIYTINNLGLSQAL